MYIDYFAKVELSDAFHQLEVDEQSKKLFTINTHKELFRFNHLSFGVRQAPAIFQQTMNIMLTGLKGIAAFIDDIIADATHNELLQHLFSDFSQIQ